MFNTIYSQGHVYLHCFDKYAEATKQHNAKNFMRSIKLFARNYVSSIVSFLLTTISYDRIIVHLRLTMTQNKSNVTVSLIIIMVLSFKVTYYDQTKMLFYLEFQKTFNFNSTVLSTFNQYFIIYILISILNSK